MKNNIGRVVLIVGSILLIPLFGNLYIEGWNWSPLDFVVMGALLFIVGLAIDYAARKLRGPWQKTIAIGGIVVIFLVVWTELAVDAVSQLIQTIF